MDLEYLPEGSDDCPLLRLYHFDAADAKLLRAAIQRLAERESFQIALHKQDWITAIDQCALTLVSENRRESIEQTRDRCFVWYASPTAWGNIAELVLPFTQEASGFQWLSSQPSYPAVLFSPSGTW